MQWLSDLLTDIANFFIEYALFIPKWIWQSVLEAISTLIGLIPAPEAFTTFVANIGSLAPSVVWFLTIMEFQFGVTVIIAATAARFLLKLIPTLGF